jgi:glutaryl-CoA dehydrogenase
MAKPSDFNWEDPLDLESWLTEEERMIRDSARAFAQDKLLPRVKTAFRDERFDREIMKHLAPKHRK